ncbi:CHAP domain-containing protein [Collinsella vaginalis]|uniref:CHAP domain-containing protein n=1 Tax=Collinsella vaginalis TaxID=1870987 RepID=UPI000A26F465|nr:CHAP domain-containing protein [Collinsella vaginalis]
MATANDLVATAAQEVGYSRWLDPLAGTKYGREYAKRMNSAWFGGNGVPYCAMFVSWCLWQIGLSVPGYPTAYVPSGVEGARRAGRLLSDPRDAQPGDIVNFDWNPNAHDGADHVGIVEANLGWCLQTIEGNTSSGSGGSQGNGGLVARRRRTWGVVHSVIRPAFDGQAAQAPMQAPQPQAPSKPAKLAEDGYWGRSTTDALQYVAGTVRDGEIWGQYTAHAWRLKGCTQGWVYSQSPKGSPAIRFLQRACGADPDGIMGPGSINALIRCLGNGIQDGVLDAPSKAIMGLQRWLNGKMGY